MSECITEVTIDHCTSLSTEGLVYKNIVFLGKSLKELKDVVSSPEIIKAIKAVDDIKKNLTKSLTIIDNYLNNENSYLTEKKSATFATEAEIKEYLKKSQSVINDFSVEFDEGKKKNPFFTIRLDNQDSYIALNQRHSITSVNSKKGLVELEAKDFKASNSIRTAVEEAPKNDLYFLRTNGKWIPFFIIPYIATDLTYGISVYAKSKYEPLRKLTSPDLLLDIISDKESLIALTDLPTDNNLYTRQTGKNVNSNEAEIGKATKDKKGVVNLNEIITPKKLSDELSIYVKDAQQDSKTYLFKDGNWVEAEFKTNGIPDLKQKTFADSALTKAGMIKFISGTLVLNSDANALMPNNLANLGGNPLLTIPSNLGSSGSYYTVKKDSLEKENLVDITNTNKGIGVYSTLSDSLSDDKIMDSSIASEHLKDNLAEKPQNYTTADDYGIEINSNGKFVLTKIGALITKDHKATNQKEGLTDLNSVCTINNILKLASENLINKRTEKIMGVSYGKLAYLNVSDNVLYSEYNKRKAENQEIYVGDLVLKAQVAKYKTYNNKSQIMAVITKATATKDNKLILFSIKAQSGTYIINKISETLFTSKIKEANNISLNLSPRVDEKGTELANKWVLFILEKENNTTKLSAYKIDSTSAGYVISIQEKNKHLYFLDNARKANLLLESNTQDNGTIELVACNNGNLGIFEYFDISQPEIRKLSSYYIVQKVQPFSNTLSKLVSEWLVKQSAGHYIYEYIKDAVINNNIIEIMSVSFAKEKIIVQMNIGYDLSLEIIKKKNIIYSYEIASRIPYLSSSEYIISFIDYLPKNHFIFVTENKKNKVKKMYEISPDKLNTVISSDPNTFLKETILDYADKIQNLMLFDGGVSSVGIDGENVVITELKGRHSTRSTTWIISPDPNSKNEANLGDLLYIY